MKIEFPSSDFDEAVSAVCHDLASDEQVRALNELLRNNAVARDEYILRLELHSRLASDPDLFASTEPEPSIAPELRVTPGRATFSSIPPQRRLLKADVAWVAAFAACLVLVAGIWLRPTAPPVEPGEPTSKAVAMLNRTADAQWKPFQNSPRLNEPLEPGPLSLEAGLAQVVFYSGARLVIEGPAELDLVSGNQAFCRKGRILVEVPAQAQGFRIDSPHLSTIDPGTSFAMSVSTDETAVHVFKGKVKLSSRPLQLDKPLEAGNAALVRARGEPVTLTADASSFASLFSFQARSKAAEARRYDQWRSACRRLDTDPSLLLHFDFENIPPTAWQIPNLGNPQAGVSDATIVGCQWAEGRWPEKRAIEFQSVNDRVRLAVPGDFDSITLAAWVCVKGLDRRINSLFMSDGFESGTIHWLIRRDGVLGLTVIGADPRDHQIVASPPVITLEKFGMWLHLAVVLDADAQRVTHYFNGLPAGETSLTIAPPFRIATAELGNWNAKGFQRDDPFMIRNFSGSMDEFLLFNRALSRNEIRTLYAEGKPQGDITVRSLIKEP